MMLKSDKEKVKTLLSETIRLLCKNGLHFKSEFSVEALVGITLDKDQEFFLSIKETVKSDIRPPPDLPKPPRERESRRSINREIKGEPGQSPSCHRKRPAETVTNDGSSELPSLSLGDMQEGEQSFWSSVTGDDDTNTNHTQKKKRLNTTDDDSNSNTVITIKGEPGSDSEEDDGGGGGEANNQIDMSGSFTYGTPVTSAQSMMGALPPGSMPGMWDQLPSFSMAGPSGMSTGTAPGVSPDAQQVCGMLYQTELFLSNGMPTIHTKKTTHTPQKTAKDDHTYIARRILQQRGKVVAPRLASQACAGMTTCDQIVLVMEELTRQGLGVYNTNYHDGNKVRKVFVKKPLDEVVHALSIYGINPAVYEAKYNIEPPMDRRY